MGFSIGGLPVAFTLFTEFCPTSGRGAWLVVLQARPSDCWWILTIKRSFSLNK